MAPRDWDAATYQRVSVPHEEWARSVLDRLGLRGDETVLDAGCGSGRVTAMPIEALPRVARSRSTARPRWWRGCERCCAPATRRSSLT